MCTCSDSYCLVRSQVAQRCAWTSILPHEQMVVTVPFCRGSCRPKKPAQSGYENYCKACFKEKFPRKFARLIAKRYSNPCRLCNEERELSGAGICKRCDRARSCNICSEVNEKNRALQCKACAATRRGCGGQQIRLAMWCTTCFAPEQIAARLCEDCSGKQQSLDAVGKECVRCKTTTDLAEKASICSTGGCKAQLRLCRCRA